MGRFSYQLVYLQNMSQKRGNSKIINEVYEQAALGQVILSVPVLKRRKINQINKELMLGRSSSITPERSRNENTDDHRADPARVVKFDHPNSIRKHIFLGFNILLDSWIDSINTRQPQTMRGTILYTKYKTKEAAKEKAEEGGEQENSTKNKHFITFFFLYFLLVRIQMILLSKKKLCFEFFFRIEFSF